MLNSDHSLIWWTGPCCCTPTRSSPKRLVWAVVPVISALVLGQEHISSPSHNLGKPFFSQLDIALLIDIFLKCRTCPQFTRYGCSVTGLYDPGSPFQSCVVSFWGANPTLSLDIPCSTSLCLHGLFILDAVSFCLTRGSQLSILATQNVFSDVQKNGSKDHNHFRYAEVWSVDLSAPVPITSMPGNANF